MDLIEFVEKVNDVISLFFQYMNLILFLFGVGWSVDFRYGCGFNH